MKIAVIGVGNIGSWMANFLKEKNEVAVYDEIQERAQKINGVSLLYSLNELAQFQPELLLNAVTIQNTVSAFNSAKRHLPDNCILCDVASVKGNLSEYYKNCGFRFVSIHPMFGPSLANVNRLEEENVIIIKESDAEGITFLQNHFRSLGLNIFYYSFQEHDQIIAYSLSVPFASSLVFASHLNSSAVPGTTFKKHLKIAKGLLAEDDYLLTEILFNPYSLSELEKITQRLEFLKHVIRERDYEEAFRFFQRLRQNLKR